MSLFRSSAFVRTCGLLSASAAAYLMYLLLKEEDDTVAEVDENNNEEFVYGRDLPYKDYFIYIPREKVGCVLGRHGSTIRRVEFETRTLLEIIYYSSTEVARVSKSDLYDAQAEWDRQCAVLSDELDWSVPSGEDRRAKPSSKYDNHAFLRVRSQTERQVTLVRLAIEGLLKENSRQKIRHSFRIPAEYAGMVIGRGGDNVRKMNQQLRVFVRVNKAEDETVHDGMVSVTVDGPADACTLAEKRVMAVVRKGEWIRNKESGDRDRSESPVHKQIEELQRAAAAAAEDDDEEW